MTFVWGRVNNYNNLWCASFYHVPLDLDRSLLMSGKMSVGWNLMNNV